MRASVSSVIADFIGMYLFSSNFSILCVVDLGNIIRILTEYVKKNPETLEGKCMTLLKCNKLIGSVSSNNFCLQWSPSQ